MKMVGLGRSPMLFDIVNTNDHVRIGTGLIDLISVEIF